MVGCATRGNVVIKFRHAALMLTALAVGILPAMGQAKPDDAKAAAPAAKEAPKPAPLNATVVSVTGIAEKRLASDPKGEWEPIKVGDVLGPLTMIRTGLGAKVTLKFAERSTLTVKSGTKIGISDCYKKGRLVRTHLGLKYGSIRTKVDRSRGPNDFKVATPVATLSIRGSGGHTAFSGDRGFGHGTDTGSYNVTSGNGRSNNVNQGETNDGNRNPSDVITQNNLAPGMGGIWGLNRNEQRSINRHGRGQGIWTSINGRTRRLSGGVVPMSQTSSGGMTQIDPPSLEKVITSGG